MLIVFKAFGKELVYTTSSVLGIKTVVAFLRDSHRGSLGLMREQGRGFARTLFITNIEDLVKYDTAKS
jgi:hypothetical protein